MKYIAQVEEVTIDTNFYLSNIFCGGCYIDPETGNLIPGNTCGEECIEYCRDSNDNIKNGPRYDIFMKVRIGDETIYIKYESKICKVLTEEEYNNA